MAALGPSVGSPLARGSSGGGGGSEDADELSTVTALDREFFSRWRELAAQGPALLAWAVFLALVFELRGLVEGNPQRCVCARVQHRNETTQTGDTDETHTPTQMPATVIRKQRERVPR